MELPTELYKRFVVLPSLTPLKLSIFNRANETLQSFVDGLDVASRMLSTMTEFYLDLPIEPLTFYGLQEKSEPLL